jgi:hypothetical protein
MTPPPVALGVSREAGPPAAPGLNAGGPRCARSRIAPRALFILFTSAALAAAQLSELRVGFLERTFPERDPRKSIVASTIAGAAAKPRDVLAEVFAGKLDVSKLDVLVLGSFLHAEPDDVTAALTRERAKLRAFVEQGGVALILPQAFSCNVIAAESAPDLKTEAARRVWQWLAPEGPTDWSGQRFDAVHDVDVVHPLVVAPHRISAARVNAAVTSEATQADAPIGKTGTRLLLGHRYKLCAPWLSEVAIGRGRVVICAGALDRPMRTSDGAAEALFRDLVANVLAYAEALRAKKAPPFEPTFKELPETTKEAVLDFDDWAGFERRVSEAVDKGVAALRKMQKRDGSFGTFEWANHPPKFPYGPTCLSIMALVASGVSKRDEDVERALRTLPKVPADNTYENGLLCLALDVKAAPDGERFEMLRLPPAERARFAFKRTLSAEDRALMEKCATWLVGARQRGFWRYLEHPVDADLSNSQYAAFGLAAAKRCGVAVPDEVFERFVVGLTTTQARGRVRTWHFPKAPVGPHEWPEFYNTRRPTGFWDYDALATPKNGRGTTDAIGVVMLASGLDALASEGVRDRRAPKAAEAVDAALTHLDAIFRTDVQPFEPGYPTEKIPDFYFLYTLERAMALIDERFIGRHDWYREAAEVLLDLQRTDGRWDVAGAPPPMDAVNTSFALLTLRRATIPTRVTPK